MEVDVERRRETTRREGRKGCAVITAQLSRLNNVERPTRRNSRRMSYRFRYFLVEEPKKGRGGIRNRERERERERERARERGESEGSITQLSEMQRSLPVHQSTGMHQRVLPSFVASGNSFRIIRPKLRFRTRLKAADRASRYIETAR